MTRRPSRTLDGCPVKNDQCRFAGAVDLNDDEVGQVLVDRCFLVVAVATVQPPSYKYDREGDLVRTNVLKVANFAIPDADLSGQLLEQLGLGLQNSLFEAAATTPGGGEPENGSTDPRPAPDGVDGTQFDQVTGERLVDDEDEDDVEEIDLDLDDTQDTYDDEPESVGELTEPLPPEPALPLPPPTTDPGQLRGSIVGRVRPPGDPRLARYLEEPDPQRSGRG